LIAVLIAGEADSNYQMSKLEDTELSDHSLEQVEENVKVSSK
jgi:hypothetical protein